MGRSQLAPCVLAGVLALAWGCQTQSPTRPDAFDAEFGPSGPPAPGAAPANGAAAAGTSGTRAAQGPMTNDRIHALVMDFTDDFTLRLADVSDRIEARQPNMESRLALHRLRYTMAHGLTLIAAGANPRVALIDATVVMSLQTRLLEERLVPRYFDDFPWLSSTFGNAAAQVRGYAEQVFSPDEMAEIDALVDAWLADNPWRNYSAYIRLADFAATRQEATAQARGRSGSILNLLFIDPLAGLDPTTRELEQARRFAERAMYYAQRMPQLISWQAELLYLDAAGEPEVQQTLLNIERLTASMETLTDGATSLRQDLPDLVAREREAAIDQASARFFEGLAQERDATLDALVARGEHLDQTLERLNTTIVAGDELSRHATELAVATQELLRTFEAMRTRGGEDDAPKTTVPEYQALIESATVLTRDLDTAITSLHTLAQSGAWEERRATIDAVTADAQIRVEAVVDRAYRRLLVVVVVVLAGALVVGLVLKFIPGRVRAA